MHSLTNCGRDRGLEGGPISKILEVCLVAILVEQFVEDSLFETTGGIFFNGKFNLYIL
jgi:hypothetical protein